MKKTKFLASLLAVLMLMATFTTVLVSANEVTVANLIIENDINTTGITIKDKTYNLYQVFSAITVTTDDDADDSIEYFVNPDFYDFFEEHKGITYPTSGDQADIDAYNHDATEYVNSFAADKTEQKLVTLLREYIVKKGTAATTTTGDYHKSGDTYETVTAQDVSLGYYVVFDSLALAGDVSETDAVTNGSLVTIPGRATDGSLTSDVTIALKGSAPKIEKDIWHNDLTNNKVDNSLIHGNKGSWDEVADYQIGDVVEFRLKVTVPDDISAYDTYEFVIKDKLSDGLSFNDDIKIYTDAALETDPVPGQLHTMSYDGPDYTFKMDFDMKSIKANYPSLEEFYIYYTATVTKDAVIATDYENNNVVLDFSNNPYDETSKGKSEDDVYGYTFDLDVLKTKGDGVTALAGAVFALYETTGGDNGVVSKQIYLAQNTNSDLTVPTYYPAKGDASETAGVITTDANGRFNIAGLDDAKDYVLVEIQAPEGYNTAEPVRIHITAKYDDNAEGIPTPTITVTGDTDSLDITVINTSAKLLPETGGMGTTVFTITGIVFMASALVLLFAMKKKAK